MKKEFRRKKWWLHPEPRDEWEEWVPGDAETNDLGELTEDLKEYEKEPA